MPLDVDQYVHYGCGTFAPPTWTNFDISPTLRIQKIPVLGALLTRGGPKFPRNVRYGDIVRGLPVPAASCNAVYCSHILEHLALEDFRIALRNTFIILRPGGRFRLLLPDLEVLARAYVESSDPAAALDFMRISCLGEPIRPRGIEGAMRLWIGNFRHLWMWDYKSIAVELENAGFTEIRRAQVGDSPEPRFKEVEEPYRWERGLGVECIRPR